MDILNSDWLIHMLNKAGKTPQARLLCLFDILDDWTDAPGVDTRVELNVTQNNALQTYLSLEAAKAGAALPEMLAMQLYVMALSACNEKLQTRLQANKDRGAGDALIHAKNAAEALIAAQTKKEFRIAKSSAYAIAASFIAALMMAGALFTINHNSPSDSHKATLAISAQQPAYTEAAFIANPEETAALIAQIDLMRKGTCQLPEALQLPDSYKRVYFQNIVLGQISTDPSDQKLVRQLLEKVRCNYTPMLMANSKN
ncbi:MAG: hypothetical protein ACKVOA_01650 [Methylophilaceae bacterium]